MYSLVCSYYFESSPRYVYPQDNLISSRLDVTVQQAAGSICEQWRDLRSRGIAG